MHAKAAAEFAPGLASAKLEHQEAEGTSARAPGRPISTTLRLMHSPISGDAIPARRLFDG